jgi:alpha,alpha-trehalase
MKLLCLFLLAAAAIGNSNLQAQDQIKDQGAGTNTESGPAPDPDKTLAYIHSAWDTLTRSMTDCHTLADSKITTKPVLYMPAELPAPPEVKALEQKCNITVQSLPRRIEKLADVRPEELSAPGLLYLPFPYVVPGGRFNEMYGWDSYFIVLGLEADHRPELAKNMVDNFLFEIEHYGAVLNANRTYYLTRSQPPFLTSMIREVYENPASFAATPEGRAAAHAWLERAYTLAEKDHSTWTRAEHKAGTTGLARYYDFAQGPVPEMADDSTYYPDVIRWLIAHPDKADKSFLVKGSEHPDAAESARLKVTSCDIAVSKVCERAWASGYRLSFGFYQGDRAMRESGFDPSFRFEAFDGATEHYAPVCLNSLLFRYERDLEHFAHVLAKPQDAMRWDHEAMARNAAMHRYLWQAKEGVFADYDFAHGKASTYAYISSLYPLWAGVATREEAKQMVSKLNLFERPGGLSMSNFNSGMQWDEPFGWAPTNWIANDGLAVAGFREDARRTARNFDATIDKGFAADGTIVEKYNVDAGNSDVHVSTGYKANQIGFGWSNAVYLKMKELIATPAALPAN